jgi:hypothetical protein
MVKNVLNLDSMRTDPKALQKFYEKVNKREQRVYNKVDNYTKEK